MKPFLNFIWEVFKIVVISLVIIIPIRYFLIQPFFVKGASMVPNYEDGEYLIIDEISYRFKQPDRGEVVVFRFPGDTRQFYIKRIIGLPEETVQINGSQIIIKNKANPEGFIIDESSYLKNVPPMGQETINLANNEFFVLGDNRSASSDSRRWGSVPGQNLVGRVWIRAWPVSRAQVMEAPAY